jgi:hypothetical protein
MDARHMFTCLPFAARVFLVTICSVASLQKKLIYRRHSKYQLKNKLRATPVLNQLILAGSLYTVLDLDYQLSAVASEWFTQDQGQEHRNVVSKDSK